MTDHYLAGKNQKYLPKWVKFVPVPSPELVPFMVAYTTMWNDVGPWGNCSECGKAFEQDERCAYIAYCDPKNSFDLYRKPMKDICLVCVAKFKRISLSHRGNTTFIKEPG